jgi:hypothetical protein
MYTTHCTVECSTLVLRMCEVPDSDLNTGTGYWGTCLLVVLSNSFIEPYNIPWLLPTYLIHLLFIIQLW